MEFERHRRLRKSPFMRDIVRETHLHKDDLIYPIFVVEKDGVKKEVPSMKGVYQISLNMLKEELDEVVSLGIKSVIFFGVPNEKDAEGTGDYHDNGIVQEECRRSKNHYFELLVHLDT